MVSWVVTEFDLDLAKALRHAGPWGQHFPEPLFNGVFEIIQQRLVGEKHLKLVLKTECGTRTLDGIAFNIDRELWPNPNVRWVELAYKLDVNVFRERESVQMMISHLSALLIVPCCLQIWSEMMFCRVAEPSATARSRTSFQRDSSRGDCLLFFCGEVAR